MEINRETADFIEQHANDDVRQLALMGRRFPHLDMPFVLDQVAGRQIARQKLPSWAATSGIVYPQHLSMEQCSSEETARYKAALVRRLMQGKDNKNGGKSERSMVDLTGGLGVDFTYMAPTFSSCIYVEQQEQLCRLARHNLPLLGLPHAEVVNGSGVDYLKSMKSVNLIYLDPARRNEHGGKTVLIADCTPDVLGLKNLLLEKAHHVVVKLSPMLHWQQAVDEIDKKGHFVREVHIVAVKNECKELLFVLGRCREEETIKVYCVNNEEVLVVNIATEQGQTQRLVQEKITAGNYLYEPYTPLMKAGCFAWLTRQWDVRAIAPNSHLFVSDTAIPQFFGRQFKISAVSSFNKQELKQHLQGLQKANITTRNFPMSVAELRKKLKLKDGGTAYLFATTTATGEKLLLVCEKV